MKGKMQMNNKGIILLEIMLLLSTVMSACSHVLPNNEIDKSFKSSSITSQKQPETSYVDVTKKPEYDIYFDDKFDAGYQKYYNYIRLKYYDGGRLSASIPDIVIMRDEQLTPGWFGLSLFDLPMVVNKLEEGVEPAYTMSLIMLMTDTDVGVLPSRGDSALLDDWVIAFNCIKSLAEEKVKTEDIKSLGYLALPEIYDELKSGRAYNIVTMLPDITEGLEGAGKAASLWGKEEWIKWLEDNAETLNTLKWMIDYKIDLSWIE